MDAEVMPTAKIQDCMNKYNNDTEVNDKKGGKPDDCPSPDEIEEMLTTVVTNLWSTG